MVCIEQKKKTKKGRWKVKLPISIYYLPQTIKNNYLKTPPSFIFKDNSQTQFTKKLIYDQREFKNVLFPMIKKHGDFMETL